MIAQTIIPMPIPVDSGPSGPIPIPVAVMLTSLIVLMGLAGVVGALVLGKMSWDEHELGFKLLGSFLSLLTLIFGGLLGTLAYYMIVDIFRAIATGKSTVG